MLEIKTLPWRDFTWKGAKDESQYLHLWHIVWSILEWLPVGACQRSKRGIWLQGLASVMHANVRTRMLLNHLCRAGFVSRVPDCHFQDNSTNFFLWWRLHECPNKYTPSENFLNACQSAFTSLYKLYFIYWGKKWSCSNLNWVPRFTRVGFLSRNSSFPPKKSKNADVKLTDDYKLCVNRSMLHYYCLCASLWWSKQCQWTG